MQFKLCRQLFLSFVKLGCLGFGGGYSIIPLVQEEISERRGWLEKDRLVDIFAVSESLPGAIALNTSAFVGYAVAGIPGLLSALAGNVLAPVCIVLTLSGIYSQIRDVPQIQQAMQGIYPAIIALIAFAAVKIGKSALRGKASVMLFLAAFGSAQFLHISPVPLIAGGACMGLAGWVYISLVAIRRVRKEAEPR